MKKTFKTVAIIGFISKGIIYLVIGTLSLLAALNMGGESSGANQALAFLKQQAFGQILLLLLGIGLLCYSFWMFVQSFHDPENIGKNWKAKFIRFGLFITGLIYVFVAFLAFYHLVTPTEKEHAAISLLNYLKPWIFSVLFICIGVILAVQGVVLVVGTFRGDLFEQFNLEGHRNYKLIRSFGKFGFYARAFVLLIIAYFFLRAGIYTGNHDIKGIRDAFAFLDHSNIGRIVMAVTAIGFISYGAFYMFLTKYRRFQESNKDQDH